MLDIVRGQKEWEEMNYEIVEQAVDEVILLRSDSMVDYEVKRKDESLRNEIWQEIKDSVVKW